ncbi:MAG: hypothetical protein NTZ53_03305 [Cyanobacteria bacterium]|nr:hypothetical protein [Cyanobacteriota bacterium]
MAIAKSPFTRTATANLRDAIKFTLNNGVVSSILEYDGGKWKNERISAKESYIYDGISLIKSETDHGRTKISTYRDTSATGIFTKVSSVYAQSISSQNLTAPVTAAIQVAPILAAVNGTALAPTAAALPSSPAVSASTASTLTGAALRLHGDDHHGSESDDDLLGDSRDDDFHGGAGNDIIRGL